MPFIKNAKFGLLFLFIFCTFFNSQAKALSLEDQLIVYESYTFESQGQILKAIEKMTYILNKNPKDYFTHYRLGWLFSIAKKYRNSIDHYEAAANLSPTSIEPWLNLSSLYINLGDYISAEKSAHELLKRNPNHYFGLLRLTLALLRQKNYSAALEKVDVSLKLYPTDPVFLEQKAYALKELGRIQEARDLVGSLILISPKNEFAKSFLNSH